MDEVVEVKKKIYFYH